MGPIRRLPDLTLGDVGRAFVMRPGSVRSLVVPAEGDAPRVSGPAVRLSPEDGDGGAVARSARRYRVEALEPGEATIRLDRARWRIVVRAATRPPEQTKDDTDEGWGEGSAHSRTWWEEQRPPHW